MIHDYLNEVTPYTEIPSWKHFDHEENETEETLHEEDEGEIQQAQLEVTE